MSEPTTAPSLTRRDIDELIRMCDQQVGRCFLDTEHGRQAKALGDKLRAIREGGGL